MRILVSCLLCLSVAGCGGLDLPFSKKRGGVQTGDGVSVDGLIRPRARPEGLGQGRVPEGARTAEEFDTTTSSERQAAQEPASGGRKLGSTVASLGSPTEPGFWLKTPLVREQGPGRVTYPATGKSVQVTLMPIHGPDTAGSRMSLAALRLIGAPLTGLPEVDVFSE